MERITLFADILLPLKVEGIFTYRVPYEWNTKIQIGQRVAVQFGKNKLYSGLVYRIHQTIPQHLKEIKYILSILDIIPVVTEKQFQLWEWIAKYYLCTLGEVMNIALPTALKLTGETKIVLNPAFDGNYQQLNEKEFLVAEALEIQHVLTLSDIAEIIDRIKVLPLVKTLIEKGIALPEEELQERYIPKKELFVTLSKTFQNEDALQQLFCKLEKRANKQLEILMAYLALHENTENQNEWLSQKAVLDFSHSPASSLKTMIDKHIFDSEYRIISRLTNYSESASVASIILSNEQQRCLDEIENAFWSKQTVLLHGVTASGKTELYIKLIESILQQGKQVLYLLPEIALSEQIINRLRKYFGNQVGIYHSRFNEHERVEIWERVSSADENKKYNIILGARSALFLPFQQLGLVIIDEEHDTSYKQFDPAPRYMGRDTAMILAKLHGAKTLLGSGTPSIESWFNAQSGKYGFVQLLERYHGQPLPETEIVNMQQEKRAKTMSSHFSSQLIDRIKEALQNKEQIILFHNRRGFAPRLVCETCGWSPECKNCDVSLVYHKQQDTLRCHYCGYSTKVLFQCAACGSTHMKTESYGTEKVEDELKLIFSDVVIERMDLDSTRGKNSHHDIVLRFEQRKTDILVGTQMVTKGLDFSNVSLVGILNADQLLSYPDFRSHERGFQTIVQVSGRAGRSKNQGRIVIQTFTPRHPVIQMAVRQLFDEMYTTQLTERKMYHYPPYVRLIRLTLKHRNLDVLNAAAQFLTDVLREKLKNRVLGPEYPPVSRIKTFYLKDILVKIEPELNLMNVKSFILQSIHLMTNHADWHSVNIAPDVDPY
jgi:primosomal protein N' (replication factor Y)